MYRSFATTVWCPADLNTVADRAYGTRISKLESAADLEWAPRLATLAGQP
jgi:hypothetical protein